MFRELYLLATSQLCVIVIILTDLLLLSYFGMVVVVVRVEARTSSVPRF